MRVQALVSAFAIALSACGSPPLRQFADVVALDDGSALLSYEVAAEGDRIGRIGVGGELQWEAQLTGKASYGVPEPNLSIHDRVVGVRVLRDRRTSLAIEAHDLADGHQVWESTIPNVSVDHATSHLRTDRSMIELFRAPGSNPSHSIVALDPSTGRVRMRSSTTNAVYESLAFGEQLVLSGGGVVVGEDGTATSNEVVGFGCLHRGALVTFRMDAKGTHQMVRSPQTGAATVVDLERQVTARGSIRNCFSYRGQLTIVTSSHPSPTTQLVFVDGAGRSTGEISVPGQLPTLWPAGAAPSGSIRFMPLITVDGDRTRLFLLDLERREAVWERDLDHRNYDVFRVNSSWFLVTKQIGDPLIAVFDGVTGELRNAVRVKANLRPIRATSIGGGSLWLMAEAHWVAAPPVARLDGTTLVVTLGSAEIPIAGARDTSFLVDLPRPTH